MYVHLKQTGERLAGPGGMGWDIDALMSSAHELAELHTGMNEIGLRGVMVVSGGGNHMRGADFVRPWLDDGKEVPESVMAAADTVGRWGTLDNSEMLAGALTALKVPNVVLLAPGMERRDGVAGEYATNTAENAQAAYKARKLVLAAGGTGDNGCSTDASVAELAMRQARRYKDAASIALKATKVAGVYNRNPDRDSDEPLELYDEIYAARMLRDPKRFGVVDMRSLEALSRAEEGSAVSLLVYNGRAFSPLNAVRGVIQGRRVGTLIRPGPLPRSAG